jgi:hypothetical protein
VKGWPAVACFLAMWAAMFWAYKTSAKQEDRNPNQFVDWLLAAATVFAVLSVLSTRPLLFGGWYNEPLAISNLPHHLLRLPRIVEQSVGSGCYLLTVFASLRTLRELERRPRFALLFILNPTVLLVLFGHNDVFLLFAALAFSLLYLVRGKWWIASGLLGLSFGFGIIGLALLACLVKHLFARTAKDRLSKQIGLVVLAFVVAAVAVMYPYGAAAMWSALIMPWTGGIGILGVFLAIAIVVSIGFVYKAELTGKDTTLFAMLFIATLFIIAGLAISVTPTVLLLILAIPFRSAPQLWLSFTIGTIALLPSRHATDPFVIAAIAVFIILIVFQSRHAITETGLFRTIDVRT